RTLCSHALSFEHPAATAISPLSLHDALPISRRRACPRDRGWPRRHLGLRAGCAGTRIDRVRAASPRGGRGGHEARHAGAAPVRPDRKSTRLNSSHVKISYAVFCLKKKKTKTK